MPPNDKNAMTVLPADKNSDVYVPCQIHYKPTVVDL